MGTTSLLELDTHTLRAMLLAAGEQLIHKSGLGPTGPMRVLVTAGPGAGLVFRVREGEGEQVHQSVECLLHASPACSDTALLEEFFFSEEDRQIVLIIGHSTMKGRAIARRLGASGKVPTRLGIALSTLVQRGVLESSKGGYRVGNAKFLELARSQAQPFAGLPEVEDPAGRGQQSAMSRHERNGVAVAG